MMIRNGNTGFSDFFNRCEIEQKFVGKISEKGTDGFG